eukprot:10901166-Alexandrium_andersonii.AAC.1
MPPHTKLWHAGAPALQLSQLCSEGLATEPRVPCGAVGPRGTATAVPGRRRRGSPVPLLGAPLGTGCSRLHHRGPGLDRFQQRLECTFDEERAPLRRGVALLLRGVLCDHEAALEVLEDRL